MKKYSLSWRVVNDNGDNIWASGTAKVIATSEEEAKSLLVSKIHDELFISEVMDEIQITVEEESDITCDIISFSKD